MIIHFTLPDMLPMLLRGIVAAGGALDPEAVATAQARHAIGPLDRPGARIKRQTWRANNAAVNPSGRSAYEGLRMGDPLDLMFGGRRSTERFRLGRVLCRANQTTRIAEDGRPTIWCAGSWVPLDPDIEAEADGFENREAFAAYFAPASGDYWRISW